VPHLEIRPVLEVHHEDCDDHEEAAGEAIAERANGVPGSTHEKAFHRIRESSSAV
jgi:hypothetical protein